MNISIICENCNCELLIKDTEINNDGDLDVTIERCTCKDEDLLEEGRADARENG
jgi:hypothetical protein